MSEPIKRPTVRVRDVDGLWVAECAHCRWVYGGTASKTDAHDHARRHRQDHRGEEA